MTIMEMMKVDTLQFENQNHKIIFLSCFCARFENSEVVGLYLCLCLWCNEFTLTLYFVYSKAKITDISSGLCVVWEKTTIIIREFEFTIDNYHFFRRPANWSRDTRD